MLSRPPCYSKRSVRKGGGEEERERGRDPGGRGNFHMEMMYVIDGNF